MYKNILIPIELDFTPDVERFLNTALGLASEGAVITALYVQEDLPDYVTRFVPDEQIVERRKATKAALADQVSGRGAIKSVVIDGHAGSAIVAYASKHDMDCIVIASHRPGLKDFFLGSTANRVVRHANCSVHVLR